MNVPGRNVWSTHCIVLIFFLLCFDPDEEVVDYNTHALRSSFDWNTEKIPHNVNATVIDVRTKQTRLKCTR